MWSLPGAGIKPLFPALAGGFLITGPPGKSNCILLRATLTKLFTSHGWKPKDLIIPLYLAISRAGKSLLYPGADVRGSPELKGCCGTISNVYRDSSLVPSILKPSSLTLCRRGTVIRLIIYLHISLAFGVS